jgi:hypothetical protein
MNQTSPARTVLDEVATWAGEAITNGCGDAKAP